MTPNCSRRAAHTDRGASIVEYALLVALVAVAAIAGLSALGTSASDSFDHARENITGPGGETPPTTTPGTPGPPPSSPAPPPGPGPGPEPGPEPGPAPSPPTTAAPAPATTVPQLPTSSVTGIGTWNNSAQTQWTSTATITILDANGQPPKLDGTQVHYERIRLVRYSPDGPIHRVTDGIQVQTIDANGTAVLTPVTVDHGHWYAVVGIEYKVTDVRRWGVTTTEWDGNKPTFTVTPG